MDDILMEVKDNYFYEFVVGSFKLCFEVRVVEMSARFLGVSAEHNDGEMKLHGTRMIERLLRHCRVGKCTLMPTTLQPRLNLSIDGDGLLTDATPYSQLVRLLLHSANKLQPEIAFTVRYFFTIYEQADLKNFGDQVREFCAI